MKWWLVLIIIFSVIIFLMFSFCLVIYFIVFYNSTKKYRLNELPEDTELRGEQYDKYYDQLVKNYYKARLFRFTDVNINSFDKKKLHGKLYVKNSKNPFIIMFHGYKGGGVRDFASAMIFFFNEGYNLLVIDERGHGTSSGRTITFGINERVDAVRWANYLYEKNSETDIYLYGISMGAATVLMSSNLNLPSNVRGIIADCPYTSPRDVMIDFSKKYKVKFNLIKPFIYLTAFILCHINLNTGNSVISVKNTNIPILLFHGTDDHLVPFSMGKEISEANPNRVKFVPIEGAPHAISFLVNTELYTKECLDFINKNRTNK